MIRFRTIEPGAPETAAAKPAAPASTRVEQPVAEDAPAPKAKGLARKTPLRAKKPDAARPFRD